MVKKNKKTSKMVSAEELMTKKQEMLRNKTGMMDTEESPKKTKFKMSKKGVLLKKK